MNSADRLIFALEVQENQISAARMLATIAVPAVFPAMLFWLCLSHQADEKGAPLIHCVGTVAGCYRHMPGRTGVPETTVSIRIGGTLASAGYPGTLQTGRKMDVYYKVGKSGEYYIESIAPFRSGANARKAYRMPSVQPNPSASPFGATARRHTNPKLASITR